MGRYSKYPKGSGIYKLTCKESNKIYIGKSLDLRKRLTKYKYNSKIYDGIIYRAIRKYGWDAFDVEILEVFSEIDNNDLLKLEASHIEKYNSTDPSIGYNLCKFSTDRTGIPVSSETKEKLRLANLGKIHSEETKQLLSDIFSGENHPMYGKTYDKEKLASRSGENSCWSGKTGDFHPTFGRTHTDEAKQKLKEKRRTQDMSSRHKCVVQFDLVTGDDIKVWLSATEAANSLNIPQSGITEVCRKRMRNGWLCKSSGGFGWKYKNKYGYNKT